MVRRGRVKEVALRDVLGRNLAIIGGSIVEQRL
jgi:hypothetical protein